MSDYKRGKGGTEIWAIHWHHVADAADSRTTIEATLIDYGQAIKTSFTHADPPDIIAMAMPPYVRAAHRAIMSLPVDQRECIVVWHFGEDEERQEKFGVIHSEPNSMKAIYRKIGRRLRH